ncbi:ROK family transcriptional regulator [Caballeronia sp. SEWSISQ10-4 2]|uniref:ROK family transcriptional regulator n=1 Tax=Caballeronia sp. SEWSISQ10-4 2 TaxID=2937438 RepID=UPI00265671E1|nr:ROK family transcriptional regulator [Caballeronia sp. SEWSISQ10-4 2]MDN7179347.1 ROK family transcriptional regulator [Caballeronia sp. SEWSISQ10-4 2]
MRASTATPKPAGMRQMNERIVLQAVRVHGPLPKSDIARLTHLSTQTASLIVDRLIDDGLLAREARTRVQGRMGQPSVPISLRADGAFSIGVKVGRRSLDVLSMDFAGHVHAREVLEYAYPDPRTVFSLLAGKLDHMMAALGDDAAKVVGIGVAAPLWLGGWRNFFDTPPEVFAAWNEIDIRARVQALTALPVEFAKDTTAACAAELLMGQGRGLRDFLYVFIGTFIGGGLVIDGRLHAGPKGNAGAVGSFPLMSEGTPQLLNVASVYVLEKRFTDAGFPAAAAHDQRALSAQLWPLCEAWLDAACPALAAAIATAAALVDLDGIVVDGELDRQLLREVLTRTNIALDAFDWQGMLRPRLVEGEIGADARAMGGAILPLYAHFAPRHVLFLKSGLSA